MKLIILNRSSIDGSFSIKAVKFTFLVHIVFQIGKTKVCLRAGQMAELDSVRNQVLGISASVVQTKFRSFFAHKNFVILRMAAIQIQALCRGIINAQGFFLS